MKADWLHNIQSLNYISKCNLSFNFLKSLEVQLQNEIEDTISPEAEIMTPFADASSDFSSLKDLSGNCNTPSERTIDCSPLIR